MNEYERCLRLWNMWRTGAPHEIEMRLDNYHMLEAFHASKLEYPDLPFNQVTSLWSTGRVSGFTGNLYGLVALSNFKVQAKLADLCIEQSLELSSELIAGLQHALSCGLFSAEQYVDREERPGEFKQLDSVNGLFDAGTSPEEIEETLDSLIAEMPRIADRNDTLVAGTYLHARLLFLRPFTVMNNATAIATMNYWLRLAGHPPVVIPSGEVLQYREYLEKFDVEGDIEPLAYYFSEKVAEFWGPQMKNSNEEQKPRFTLRM